MDFWGVEVPAGKPISCSPGEGMYLHVSQVALGESKVKGGKGNDRVVLKVQVDDSEVVLGTLSEGKCDQMQLDLVFDREFKVSHNSSSSSVYICGYRTEGPEEHGSEDEDEDEDEEDGALAVATIPVESNGSKIIKEVTDKAATDVAKVVEKAMQDKSLKKQVVPDGDSDEEDDEEDSDDDMDEDEDDEGDEDEDDSDDSDESEEEELAIETAKAGKKRAAAEVATKDVEKKSKMDVTPKSAPGSRGKKGDKGGQVTPVTKEAPKTPTDKGVKLAKALKGTPTAPPPTPVSEKKAGPHQCTGCDRTFTTESAMSQHIAAKHKS
ncbi:histone deacetylase HDT1 isoform X3 [Physcomitrium patens]|uniref:C2H2-type domain-containing protein n=2 Tax=Physcomitrium patens TaxID=3218 RepID=A0A2K1L160_PHYPA|nr:histone deacetylase HDT1-like isoform X3 [Physcomitrium patens]PNR59764.1 hypothetical protein PHYPA_002556 [Physcomitrium patens]|eukprot:XP_024368928.1 histone deacetylase HDT1-like isoform X3 [Physcomitrella patens]